MTYTSSKQQLVVVGVHVDFSPQEAKTQGPRQGVCLKRGAKCLSTAAASLESRASPEKHDWGGGGGGGGTPTLFFLTSKKIPKIIIMG